VVGSISDEVIGHSTIALGSTQPLTKMNARDLPGGKEQPEGKVDLIAICEPISRKM
jgi:hypothetical protein